MLDARQGEYVSRSWRRTDAVRDVVAGWMATLYHVITPT